jgi:hypothetical protein
MSATRYVFHFKAERIILAAEDANMMIKPMGVELPALLLAFGVHLDLALEIVHHRPSETIL